MLQKHIATILIFSENSELVCDIGDFLAEAQYNSVHWPYYSPLKDILPLRSTVQAIILDLPDEEDEASYLVRTLKTQAPVIPIIALVSEGNVRNAVMIIQEGARTALSKPIDKLSLLAALNSIGSQPANSVPTQTIIQQAIDLLQSLNMGQLPRVTNSQQEADPIASAPQGVLKLNDLIVDLTRQKAFYRDVLIDLTTSQFRLLSCLAKSHRRIVPYEDLYFYLHNIQLDSAAARTALSAHLSYLRTKLSEVGCEEYLVNIRGRGYMLDVPPGVKTRANDIDIDLVLQQLPITVWITNTDLDVTSILGVPLFQLGTQSIRIMELHVSDFLQLDAEHPLLFAHRQALIGQRSRSEQWLGQRLFYTYILPYRDHNNEIIGSMGLALHLNDSKTGS